MKRVAFGLIVLLLTATVFTAGCIVNTSNPTATATATPKPDYSTTFARIMRSTGWTAINPISQLSENVYSGSYRSANLTWEVKIEVAQSETAAKTRYGELVLQKQDDGYSSESGGIGVGSGSIFGDVKAEWFGSKVLSLGSSNVVDILYTHNTETDKWIVVSLSTKTGIIIS